MLRISKLTDYGTVVLASLVGTRHRVISAAELSTRTDIALPTVSKLLKSLAKSGLVESSRGANGGYRLARDPEAISAADIIDASDSQCDYEDNCNTGAPWQRVNKASRNALLDVSLLDLARDARTHKVMQFGGMPITIERTTHGD